MLLAAQRRFLGALLEPLAGENRALAALPPGAAAPTAAFHAAADELLRSTDAVPARERLGLYHRQYWFRLLDSLAEDFPRVRDFLGGETSFAAFERYLRARPPGCWTLRHLGAGFADHLRADAAIPAFLRPWAAAFAAYDYAHMEIFEAAALPAPADADLASRALTLQPGVALVPVERPISRLLTKNSARSPAAVLSLRPRRELQVVWRTAEHALRARREPLVLLPLLQSLRRGGALDTLLASARPLPPPALIEAAFARWRAFGWLALAPAAASARAA